MSEDLLDDDQNGTGALPQMLNVLTILTFIGSGVSLLMNIWSFFTHESKLEEFYENMATIDSAGGTGNSMVDGMMEGAVVAMENGPTLYTIAIVVALLCIFAAMQMRKLKKTGYYIYVVACILGLVLPLLIIGGGVMGGIMGAVGGVISVTFIILYGVNLKHMK